MENDELKINESVLLDGRLLLERAIHAIRNKNTLELEKISNETIHNASIYQDTISLDLAVLVLSIYKLEVISIDTGIQLPQSTFVEKLEKLHELIYSGKIRVFNDTARSFMQELEIIGKKMNQPNIIDRSEVKKVCKLYDHGLSMAQAASTLGVSQWALCNYIGRTKLNDYPEDVDKRVKQRVEYTRKLFL